MYFGVDSKIIMTLLDSTSLTQTSSQRDPNYKPSAEQQLAPFTAVALADTEDTWHALFQKMGKSYVEPKLVLFTDVVHSACGRAETAMGPFYCLSDKKNLY